MLERNEKESNSTYWLTDLVNELCCSPDTQPELLCSPVLPSEPNKLEVFQAEVSIPVISTEDENNFYDDHEITDEATIQAMETWEENQVKAVLDSWDYNYLLTDEVSEFLVISQNFYKT